MTIDIGRTAYSTMHEEKPFYREFVRIQEIADDSIEGYTDLSEAMWDIREIAEEVLRGMQDE